MATPDTHGTSRSVRSTFRILRILAEHRAGLRLAAVTTKSDLPKTTVHRILHTLANLGVVCRDPVTKVYRLPDATANPARGPARPRQAQFRAPILGRHGHPVAALVLCVPSAEVPDAAAGRLASLANDAAAYVSDRISKPDRETNSASRMENSPEI